MDYERIEKERAYEAQKMNQAQAGPGAPIDRPYQTTGVLGTAYDSPEPCRPSLRERVTSHLYRARKEADTRNRLEELQFLLDKNPDIARILDLIEDVRY